MIYVAITMSAKVKLSHIIDEVEAQLVGFESYLNKNTGKIISLSEDDIYAANQNNPLDQYPEWQHEQIKLARDLEENIDLYLPLPTNFEINEYRIMEDFCYSIDDDHICESLLQAIKGKGAFRRFKEEIQRFKIVQDWYSYRDQAIREIVKQWCEDHQVEYVDG